MDVIEIAIQASKWTTDPHPVWVVNGEPFDRSLAALTKNSMLEGLVAAEWGLDDPTDGDAADLMRAHRACLDAQGRVPLLICPDCCDLSCSVVFAEVAPDAGEVTWQKIGQQLSDGSVAWFPGISRYVFAREQYSACLAALSAHVGG
tara:strand:+ start:57984 stop:58424 length:441 start_codon:yes stop_codon:yes gene_type:complete